MANQHRALELDSESGLARESRARCQVANWPRTLHQPCRLLGLCQTKDGSDLQLLGLNILNTTAAKRANESIPADKSVCTMTCVILHARLETTPCRQCTVLLNLVLREDRGRGNVRTTTMCGAYPRHAQGNTTPPADSHTATRLAVPGRHTGTNRARTTMGCQCLTSLGSCSGVPACALTELHRHTPHMALFPRPPL